MQLPTDPTSERPSPQAPGLPADALLDALPLGVLVLDAQGIVRRANPLVARWCGAAPAALLGQPLAEAGLPPALSTALGQLLEPDAAGPCEVFLPQPGQWVSFSATRQGGGWVLCGQDITPQKQREQQYQALAENTPDVLTRWGPDLRLRYANAALATQAGQPLSALLGRTLAEMGAAADAAGPYLAALQRVFDTGQPQEHYYIFRGPAGPVQYHACLVPELRDGQVDTVLGIGRDITELKQTQAEALRLQSALMQHTSDQYHALFQRMDQGFCVLELQFDDLGQQVVDFRYLQVNPVFFQQSGIPEDALGKTSREVLPDLEPFWFDTYGRVFHSGESIRLTHYVPQVGRWFDVHTFRVGAPAARQVGVLFHDITARKQAEQQLRRAAADDAFRLQLADALARLTDPVAMQETVTRLARQQFGADHCHYGEIVDGQIIIRRDAVADGLPSVAGTYSLVDFALVQAAFAAGRPFSVRDARHDEAVDERLRQLCAQLHVVSYLNVPILKKGQAAGVLCLVQRAPRDWTAAEMALAAEVAERTWAAVERARAETSLAASEEKYRVLFDSIDEGFATLDVLFDADGQAIDYRIGELNQAYEKMTGMPRTVAGRRVRELVPDVEEVMVQRYGEVVRTGEPVRYEQHVVGLGRWFDVFSARVGGAGSRTVASVFNDITARKRHEANLAFLAEVGQDLVGLTSIDETMAVLGAKLGAHFQASACVFTDIDEAAGVFSASHDWHRAEVPGLKGTYRYEEFHTEEFRQASRAGQTYVVRNAATDPRVNGASLAATGIGAFVNVPLVRHGAWLFNLGLCDAQPRDWRPDEVELLRELTTRIWTRLERARAEEALHRSEEQFRMFVTASSDILYRMDANWQYMLQLDGRNVLADTAVATATWLTAYIPPTDQPTVAAAIAAAIAGRHFFALEHRVVQADGSVGWTSSHAVPVLNAAGELVEWFGTATDITARKQAEEALRLSQQQLAELNTELEQRVAYRTQQLQESRDLLHAIAEAQVGYISAFKAVRDEQGHLVDLEYIFVNSKTARLADRHPSVGRRFLEVFPEQADGLYLNSYRRVVETGVSDDREVFYTDSAGHITGWYRSSATKLDDGVLVVGEDISARKLAEQERLKNLRLLEQAEAVAGLGSWDYDLLTRQFFWSEGMYQLFGLPSGQPVAPEIYLAYVLDEDRPLAEQLVQCLTTGRFAFEDTLSLRVAGQVKTVRAKAVVLHNAAGQPVRVLGVDLDISQLRRLEADNLHLRLTQQQALFEAVQAAQEHERKRMAESLHNGIGQVLYATKLRLDQLHAPELHALPALAVARNEANQLLGEAIRQTRVLSHELVPLALEEFGLVVALQDIGRRMSTTRLRLRCPVRLDEEAGPLGPALQLALYRMAQELAQNIVKHAQGATQASLELETTPGWVLLRAEDNGSGFAPAPAESAGLGLRSIRDRVALLGGQLETGSAPDSGAYVRIRIPLATAPPP